MSGESNLGWGVPHAATGPCSVAPQSSSLMAASSQQEHTASHTSDVAYRTAYRIDALCFGGIAMLEHFRDRMSACSNTWSDIARACTDQAERAESQSIAFFAKVEANRARYLLSLCSRLDAAATAPCAECHAACSHQAASSASSTITTGIDAAAIKQKNAALEAEAARLSAEVARLHKQRADLQILVQPGLQSSAAGGSAVFFEDGGVIAPTHVGVEGNSDLEAEV